MKEDNIQQRILAVERFRSGESPETICASFRKSRSWLYKWSYVMTRRMHSGVKANHVDPKKLPISHRLKPLKALSDRQVPFDTSHPKQLKIRHLWRDFSCATRIEI